MKRIKFSISILLLVILTGCTNVNKKPEYIFDINIKDCKILKEEDTHGGFHGDGEYYLEVSCDKKEITTWKKLPLSDELQKFYNNNLEDKIPNIKEGYYHFIDRHDEAKNRTSDIELNKRASYNFSIAFYDTKTNKIYLYELDT